MQFCRGELKDLPMEAWK